MLLNNYEGRGRCISKLVSSEFKKLHSRNTSKSQIKVTRIFLQRLFKLFFYLCISKASIKIRSHRNPCYSVLESIIRRSGSKETGGNEEVNCL